MSMISRKTPEGPGKNGTPEAPRKINRESGMVKKTLICEDGSSSSEIDDGNGNTPSINSKNLSKNKSRKDNQSVQTERSRMSKTNKSKHDLEEESSPFCAATSIVLSTVILLLLSMYIVVNLKPDLLEETLSDTQISGKGEAFKRFSRDLEKIKAKYPQQNPKSWSKLSGSIRRNMQGMAICVIKNPRKGQ